MIRKFIILILTAFFVIAAEGCYAVGFGMRAGVSGQYMRFRSNEIGTELVDAKSVVGFNVGIYTDIRVLRMGGLESKSGLYIRPEGVFSQTSYNVASSGGAAAKVRMQSVDIPVLVNLKFSAFRVYAGPTLTAMHKSRSKNSQELEFESIKPFVNYTAGIGLDLGIFTIDARYNGTFKDLTNSIRLKGMETGADVKSGVQGWAISVGVAF